MALFIELKNEFADFRKDTYNKVDSFSKLICPTDDTIQNEVPRPSLQREIIETELKSETSTYASVAQTSSAIPESKFKVFGPVIKDKRVNPKVVINGARAISGLKIIGKMLKRKIIFFLSRLGPDTTANDITNFLDQLNLKFFQCHRLKTKYQSYASFHIEVYENDLQQLLDSTFSPEGCLIAEFYAKLRNDQISQEIIPGSDSNHPSCLDLSANTDSKSLPLLYQNVRGLSTKTSSIVLWLLWNVMRFV
ncbi:hypothetical protein AVEN_85222-1 [Araneus ventricosus]|uniref:Uncharacterized protein n=1 Tax=Araneus ventricosus TaxID=182803 RepID=A0A4Y2ECH4_ARAVE|nr:hypothetical protein AVEN_85222-1 [Araneus ventricosus]